MTVLLRAAFVLALLLTAAHDARALERVAGAPIFVLDRDSNSPSTTTASVPAPAPRPVAAPVTAPVAPARDAGVSALTRGILWACLLAALLAVKFLRGPAASSSFSFAKVEYPPGVTVRGELKTSARPTEVRARLELYRMDDDRPVRSVEVRVAEPEQTPAGWRTCVEADLPADAIPDFDGGWALSVDGRVDGRSLHEGDNIELLSFYLDEEGPFAPGASVRGVLLTKRRPAGLTTGLDLYRTGDASGNAERKSPGRVVETAQAEGGWRTVVEAELPKDARPDFPGTWVLWAEGKDGSDEVAEEADVALG